MEDTVLKYLNHVIEYHDMEFACKILEEYVLSSINKNQVKSCDNFIYALGNLTFIYSKKEINKKRAEHFINELFQIIPLENKYIIKHLSNFLEHIMIYNSQLVYHYLNKINNVTIENKDNAAVLYKAVILSSLKNDIDLNYIFPLIKYPWRSYFELSNYHLYYNNHNDALNYIDKAIRSCPLILKDKYLKRKDYILAQNTI